MTILLRVLLNSIKTQVIQIFPQLKCSIGELAKNDTNKSMHFIYFFENNVNAGVFALVHGKENDINVSI